MAPGLDKFQSIIRSYIVFGQSNFSVMGTTYAVSWSDMTQPCDMDLWVMK